jgi:hypothetical protein
MQCVYRLVRRDRRPERDMTLHHDFIRHEGSGLELAGARFPQRSQPSCEPDSTPRDSRRPAYLHVRPSRRSRQYSDTDSASRERSPHPAVAVHASRCVSVAFATAPTFTERPHLWQELGEKLGVAHGTGLAHAIAVIGLGDTGKTRLVLRYVEEHEGNYDTVFWIDLRKGMATSGTTSRTGLRSSS